MFYVPRVRFEKPKGRARVAPSKDFWAMVRACAESATAEESEGDPPSIPSKNRGP